MRTGLWGSLRVTAVLMSSNLILWVVWAINFVVKSQPYTPHVKVFEEYSPPYIFWGRAFPFTEYGSPVMQATKILQWPSFHAAIPLSYFFSQRGDFIDKLYWRVSVGGYYLLLVFLLSFIQWYFVGWVIQKLWAGGPERFS